MREYVILLPNERIRAQRFITMLILLINCIVFSSVVPGLPDGKMKNLALSGAMIGSVSIIFFLLSIYSKRYRVYRPEFSFIVMGIFWLILGKYLFAVCILFFAVIGFYARRKFEVVFSADKIVYPSFPVKKYLWTEVNNVMLKDNVLTIDLKNNKLIQVVIENGSVEEIDEDLFNEFCQLQMNK